MSSGCPFPFGSVGHNLWQLKGTWHDCVELFELNGHPLEEDTAAGSPGQSPSPTSRPPPSASRDGSGTRP